MPSIDIKDQVTAALANLRASVVPERLNPAIGAAEVRLFQNWFLSLPENKEGWPSIGFYADAARATNFQLLADAVVISINKLGIRQRLEGGEIHPTDGKKYLTIPARAEAYGKRAGEFSNLKLAFRRVGGVVEAWALVEANYQDVSLGRKRKDGSRNVTAGSEHGGAVMFWLVKSVTQKPDPGVLPPDDAITATAMETIAAAVDRATRRSGPSTIDSQPSTN